MTRVAITQSDNIEQAIAQALNQFSLKALLEGRRVAIHPNDTWASAEDKTAVTQPDSLRAVLREVKRFSPKELIVSGGSGAGETDEILLTQSAHGTCIHDCSPDRDCRPGLK